MTPSAPVASVALMSGSPFGRFGPLAADHPAVGDYCPLCCLPFEVGQRPSLLDIGPADAEEAALATAGRAHNVACEIVHETCAYPDPPEPRPVTAEDPFDPASTDARLVRSARGPVVRVPSPVDLVVERPEDPFDLECG